jgi:hypothetical protein
LDNDVASAASRDFTAVVNINARIVGSGPTATLARYEHVAAARCNHRPFQVQADTQLACPSAAATNAEYADGAGAARGDFAAGREFHTIVIVACT